MAANHTRAFVQSALTWSQRLSTPSEERDLSWRTIHRQSRECPSVNSGTPTGLLLLIATRFAVKSAWVGIAKNEFNDPNPLKKNVSPALQTVVENSILLPLRKDYISVDHIELKLHNQSTTQLAYCIYPTPLPVQNRFRNVLFFWTRNSTNSNCWVDHLKRVPNIGQIPICNQSSSRQTFCFHQIWSRNTAVFLNLRGFKFLHRAEIRNDSSDSLLQLQKSVPILDEFWNYFLRHQSFENLVQDLFWML